MHTSYYIHITCIMYAYVFPTPTGFLLILMRFDEN
jgi:hypothetical protein